MIHKMLFIVTIFNILNVQSNPLLDIGFDFDKDIGDTYKDIIINSYKPAQLDCNEAKNRNVSGVKLYNDVRLAGHYTTKRVKSAYECWKKCALDSNCMASSIYNTDCYFYNCSFTSEYEEGWTSYSLVSILSLNRTNEAKIPSLENLSVDCGEAKNRNMSSVKLYEGVRLGGHYNNKKVDSAEKCWEKCALDPNCMAITYSDSDCYFYDCLFTYSNDSNWQSYSLISINLTSFSSLNYTTKRLTLSCNEAKNRNLNKVKLFNDIQLEGHYKKIESNSADKCLQECSLDPNCMAITYSSFDCYFFDCSFTSKKVSGWTSYSMISIKFPNSLECDEAKNRNLSDVKIYNDVRLGGYYKMVGAQSAYTCWQKCALDSNCMAISFSPYNSDGDSVCFFHDCSLTHGYESDWTAYSLIAVDSDSNLINSVSSKICFKTMGLN